MVRFINFLNNFSKWKTCALVLNSKGNVTGIGIEIEARSGPKKISEIWMPMEIMKVEKQPDDDLK